MERLAHLLYSLLALLLLALPCAGQQAEWVKKESNWRSHKRQHFTLNGVDGYVVAPKEALPGKPWIWRARFPTYHDEMDAELVGKGFHLLYIDVAGLFGASAALERGEHLYKFATETLGLSKQACMEGVSRGGLFVYNWAVLHPDRVRCIYCDTPVCDIRSWPGGKGTGIGSEATWKQCLGVYKLTEETAEAFRGNPIDHAEVIAKAKIPILHIVSETDVVVPPAENSYVLKVNLEKAGGSMDVISVPMGTEKSKGHHFTHPDPKRVVKFFLENNK